METRAFKISATILDFRSLHQASRPSPLEMVSALLLDGLGLRRRQVGHMDILKLSVQNVASVSAVVSYVDG